MWKTFYDDFSFFNVRKFFCEYNMLFQQRFFAGMREKEDIILSSDIKKLVNIMPIGKVDQHTMDIEQNIHRKTTGVVN